MFYHIQANFITLNFLRAFQWNHFGNNVIEGRIFDSQVENQMQNLPYTEYRGIKTISVFLDKRR